MMTPDLNEDSNSMATTSGQVAASSEEANGDGQAGTSTRRGSKKITGVHDKNAKKKKRVTTATNQSLQLVISTTTTTTTAKLVKRTRLEHKQEREDEDDHEDDGDDSDATVHGRLLRAKTSSHVAVSSKKPPLDINHEYVFSSLF